MKNFTKWIPIFCIVITTILSIMFFDLEQSRSYIQFKEYDRNFIKINYSDKVNNDSINEILKIAKSNNVIISKTNINSKDGKEKNIYLSFDSTDSMINFLSKNYHISIKNNLITNNSYVSTYDHNDKLQNGIISDLLKNDKYNYYTFENLIQNNGNIYGEYIVYYKNYSDFSNFCNSVRILINENIHSDSKFNNSQNYIMILTIISVLIIMLFYFIFCIFNLYHKSKQIGCMKLLGFEKFKINNVILKRDLTIYIISIILVNLLAFIFVPNINLLIIFYLFIIGILLLLFTYLINYLSVKIIFNNYSTSNILKKQNIASKISKVCSRLKISTIILLLCCLSFIFQNIIVLNKSLTNYNNSKNLLDYGIIYDFNPDSKDLFNYDKHANLYEIIVKDKRLTTFYSEFSKYRNMPKEVEKAIEQSEKDGTDFRYASVDNNYLKNENIIVYDNNDNVVDIDSINDIYFLFPKSKKNVVSQFNSFYEKYSKYDYDNNNMEYNFELYFYNDQKINSYREDLSFGKIDSPIIRVINETLRLSYLDTPVGLSTFGNSLTTGLKIKIINDRQTTFSILEQDIKLSQLDELLTSSNFRSFYEYYNDEIQLSQLISILISTLIIIMLIVYLFVSTEEIELYVKSHNQEILVKYILGIDKYKIFDGYLNRIIKNNIISFIITVIILFLTRIINFYVFFIAVSIFLVIDLAILFLKIRNYNFQKIYSSLKGEYDD